MIVEQIMNKEVYTLTPSNTIRAAIELMKEKAIRHIPILNETKTLVGLITENHLKPIMSSTLKAVTYETPIRDIMITDIVTCHPLDFIEDVALTMYDTKFSWLPIVSGGKLVGIVSTSDLLYSYIELTGANKPSSKIDIRVKDRSGILSDITEVFKVHNANVLSVLVYPENDDHFKIVSIRVQMINPLLIIADLRQRGFDVLWPNLPGM